MATYGTRLTTAGAVLLAKALNGKPLNFVRGAFGDARIEGQVITPTDAQQDELTELIRERMSLPITEYKIDKDTGDMIVTVTVRNARVANEFKIREVGLFAKDPDSGQSLLYGYFYDAEGGKMYSKDSAVTLEYLVDLVATVGNAENVTATITVADNIKPGDGLDRMGDTISAKIASTTQLGVVKIGDGLHMSHDSITSNIASATVLGSIKVGKGLYMTGDSLNASVESGELDLPDIDLLNSRLRQLEINQTNLYLKLEAENDLGMTANLLLVEDFIDQDCIDKTTVPINYLTTLNTHMKTTSNIPYLEVGADYSVVNGTNQEDFRISNICRWLNDLNQYFFQLYTDPSPSEFFLNTENSFVYRTTATIKDHVASGPGKMESVTYNMVKKWYGEGATDSEEVVFNTTKDNASKFRLLDDWLFTSNGYFTLG